MLHPQKEDELALPEQILHDPDPFRIEWFSANGLACPTIPVGCSGRLGSKLVSPFRQLSGHAKHRHAIAGHCLPNISAKTDAVIW
jgi:hypothetical protein